MAQQVLEQQIIEGTWEEIAARAGELTGKRLKVVIETDITDSFSDIPRVGPPNEGMRAALAEIRERQKGQRQTLGDGVAIVRHGRTGPIYGRESVEDPFDAS